MAAKPSIGERLFGWVGSNVAFKTLAWVLSGGLPVTAGAATLLTGYFEQVPWVYIIPATALSAAMTATALLRFSEWLARTSVAEKLVVLNAGLAFDAVSDATGALTGISFVQHGFTLINKAGVKISYIIEDLSWSVDGKVTNEPIVIKEGEVPTSSGLEYRPPRIDFGGAAPKDRYEGRLKFKIRYGRPGREHYELKRHLNLNAILDPITKSYSTQLFHDVPE